MVSISNGLPFFGQLCSDNNNGSSSILSYDGNRMVVAILALIAGSIVVDSVWLLLLLSCDRTDFVTVVLGMNVSFGCSGSDDCCCCRCGGV